jgi:hypothetical protein
VGWFSFLINDARPFPVGRGGVPAEVDCHIRQRLSMLEQRSDDYWWDIDLAHPASSTVADVRERVDAAVFPYFERVTSEAAMIDFIREVRFKNPRYQPIDSLLILALLAKALGKEELLREARDEIGRTYPMAAKVLLDVDRWIPCV